MKLPDGVNRIINVEMTTDQACAVLAAMHVALVANKAWSDGRSDIHPDVEEDIKEMNSALEDLTKNIERAIGA